MDGLRIGYELITLLCLAITGLTTIHFMVFLALYSKDHESTEGGYVGFIEETIEWLKKLRKYL